MMTEKIITIPTETSVKISERIGIFLTDLRKEFVCEESGITTQATIQKLIILTAISTASFFAGIMMTGSPKEDVEKVFEDIMKCVNRGINHGINKGAGLIEEVSLKS